MKHLLFEQIRACLDVNNYSLYIYGSSAIDLLHGRDIDAVAIGSDISEAISHEISISLDQHLRTCNLYLIPERVYLDDVYGLTYGGYYAHKFALCFTPMEEHGISMNAPFVFWANELRNYLMQESTKQIPKPERLIAFVHAGIFRFRPDFIRPLSKFISNSEQQSLLRNYVASEIIPKGQNIVNSQVPTSKYDYEKIFYLYWKEYNRHKHNSTLWGERTFVKLSDSFKNIDVVRVERYLSNFDYGKLKAS